MKRSGYEIVMVLLFVFVGLAAPCVQAEVPSAPYYMDIDAAYTAGSDGEIRLMWYDGNESPVDFIIERGFYNGSSYDWEEYITITHGEFEFIYPWGDDLPANATDGHHYCCTLDYASLITSAYQTQIRIRTKQGSDISDESDTVLCNRWLSDEAMEPRFDDSGTFYLRFGNEDSAYYQIVRIDHEENREQYVIGNSIMVGDQWTDPDVNMDTMEEYIYHIRRITPSSISVVSTKEFNMGYVDVRLDEDGYVNGDVNDDDLAFIMRGGELSFYNRALFYIQRVDDCNNVSLEFVEDTPVEFFEWTSWIDEGMLGNQNGTCDYMFRSISSSAVSQPATYSLNEGWGSTPQVFEHTYARIKMDLFHYPCDRYMIERKINDGNWSICGFVAGDNGYFEDDDVSQVGEYAYRARLMGSNWITWPSEVVAVYHDPDMDTDEDGLSDRDEIETYGTDYQSDDTDEDGMSDGWEIAYELNPLLNDTDLDPDNDTLVNGQEYMRHVDPHNFDILYAVEEMITIPQNVLVGAMNRKGQCVGLISGNEDEPGIFIIDDSEYVRLPFIPVDINNNSQIVGLCEDEQYDEIDPSFMYDDGIVTQLEGFEPCAINDYGIIAGRNWEKRPGIYENGIFVQLGDSGCAFDINNHGDVLVNGMLYSEGEWMDLGLSCIINNSGHYADVYVGSSNLHIKVSINGEEFNHQLYVGYYGTERSWLSDSGRLLVTPYYFNGPSETMLVNRNSMTDIRNLIVEGSLPDALIAFSTMNDYDHIILTSMANLNENEILYRLIPVNVDRDDDGLSDYEEYNAGTLCDQADTDGDGLPDGWELDNGLNPLLSDADGDADGDGASNGLEYASGTDPQDAFSLPPGDGYRVVSLGTLGGTASKAAAMNQSGVIVGSSQDSSGVWKAFSYQNTVMSELGSLNDSSSWAYDINDNGIAVGKSMGADGTLHSVKYDGGVIDLSPYAGTGWDGVTLSINNIGDVVGYYHVPAADYLCGSGPPYATCHRNQEDIGYVIYADGTTRLFYYGYSQYSTYSEYTKQGARMVDVAENSLLLGYEHWDACMGGSRMADPFVVESNEYHISDQGDFRPSKMNELGVIAGTVLYGSYYRTPPLRFHDIALVYDSRNSTGYEILQNGVPRTNQYGKVTAINNQCDVVGFLNETPFISSESEWAVGAYRELEGMMAPEDADNWQIVEMNAVGEQVMIVGAGIYKEGSMTAVLIVPDYDEDEDGMLGGWEVAHGLNPLDSTDADQDLDNDGLSNYEEYLLGIDISNADSDGDGMPDGWENDQELDPGIDDANEDPDVDGLRNLDEYLNETDVDNPDTDGDGLCDGDEVLVHGTDPLCSDTDMDGMPDAWEVCHNLNPLNADDATGDADGDTVSNLDEYTAGTDPQHFGLFFGVTEVAVSGGSQYVTFMDMNESGEVLMSGDVSARLLDVHSGEIQALPERFWRGSLNNNGQIAAMLYLETSYGTCIIENNQVIDEFEGYQGYDINDAGVMIGMVGSICQLYKNGTFTDVDPIKSGRLINNEEVMVGYATNNYKLLVRVEDDVVSTLTEERVVASSLNEAGDVAFVEWISDPNTQYIVKMALNDGSIHDYPLDFIPMYGVSVHMLESGKAVFVEETAQCTVNSAWMIQDDEMVNLNNLIVEGNIEGNVRAMIANELNQIVICSAVGIDDVKYYLLSPINQDVDDDGLTDYEEVQMGTDVCNPDTDGDGLPDGWEADNGFEPVGVSDEGLIAWWPMDEVGGTSVRDRSGNGHDGVLKNAEPNCWNADGVFGGCLEYPLDSVQWVDLGYSNDLGVEGTALTISFWYQPYESTNRNQMLISRINWNLNYEIAAGYDNYLTFRANVNSNGCATPQSSATQCRLEEWNHIVGVYDGAILRLYLNGEEVAQQTAVGELVSKITHLVFGYGNEDINIAGKLDDVRLYRAVLSADDVQALYEPMRDDDGDGISNYQEYHNQTDPSVFNRRFGAVLIYECDSTNSVALNDYNERGDIAFVVNGQGFVYQDGVMYAMDCYPKVVNNHGQMVVYDPGTETYGMYDGENYVFWDNEEFFDINDVGEMVGCLPVYNPDYYPEYEDLLYNKAIRYSAGVVEEIGITGVALSINNAGEIAGTYSYSFGQRIPFYTQDGVPTVIDPPGSPYGYLYVDMNNYNEMMFTHYESGTNVLYVYKNGICQERLCVDDNDGFSDAQISDAGDIFYSAHLYPVGWVHYYVENGNSMLLEDMVEGVDWNNGWFCNVVMNGLGHMVMHKVENGKRRIYVLAPMNRDSDQDGLPDYAEINRYNTNPGAADTDADGLSDQWELEHGLDPLNAEGELLGWWSFDDDIPGYVTDISGNEHHGELRNPEMDPYCVGVDGVGLNFTPGYTQWIDMGFDDSLDVSGHEVTVCLWYKAAEMPAKNQILVSKIDYDPNYSLTMGYYNTPKFSARVNDSVHQSTASSHAAQGEWVHIVGIYDGKSMKIYLNGVLSSETKAIGSLNINEQRLRIGCSSSDYNIRGQIDDVRIYRVALDEEALGRMQ